MPIPAKTLEHVTSAFKVSPGWVAGILGLAAAMYLAVTVISHEEGQGGAVAVSMTQLTGSVERSIARKIRGVFRFRYRHKSPHVVQVQF